MLRENSLQFGIRIPENSYIDEDSIMAEVINAVDGNITHHFANKQQIINESPARIEELGALMLNEEDSFIGLADFEQEVVKGSHNEETLFDYDIMHSLL